MRSTWFLIVIVGSSSPALAQEAGSNWQGSLDLSVNQPFESSGVFDVRDRAEQNPEFEVAGTFETPPVAGKQRLSLKVGGAYSPSYYRDRPADSAAFIEVGFGSAPYPITAITRRANDATESDVSKVQDSFVFNVSYRHSEDFARFFASGAGNSETAKLKIGYSDIRSILCARGVVPGRSADLDGACSNVPGISYAIGLEATRNWSTNPEDDQEALSLKGKVVGAPLRNIIRPYAAVSGGYGHFRNVTVPDGNRRRDWSYAAQLGVDFEPLMPKGVSLDVGLSQGWNRSNLDAEDGEEFTIAVSLSWNIVLFE